MPVNYQPPHAQALWPIAGLTLGITEAGIRYPHRKDLLLIKLDAGAQVAGVFTQNTFCAAPVRVSKAHLENADVPVIQALLVNTGCANAATGETGYADAIACCMEAAQLLGCAPNQILPFSTGVILEPLPVERLLAGLPACIADLHEHNWLRAAEAIMTTDTVPKAASQQITIDGNVISITGIAKGSGMIKPNMATMLGFIATDATIAQPVLAQLVREVADASFNCITVDGDTSTNDAFMLIATGRATGKSNNLNVIAAQGPAYLALRQAITEIALELAQAIIRDGEGATKFMSIEVEGGRTQEECRAVGYAIAQSPLVKTAFFASDPNLGRILAAIGNAGIDDLDVNRVRVWLETILVSSHGGRDPSYQEADGVRVMQNADITVRIDLGLASALQSAKATVWTCDFSYDYVKINADYRS